MREAVTRLLPTAGLGDAAVTVWALRAHGVRTRELAERLLAFLVLLYAVYTSALVASGAAVALGLVAVPHGRGLGILAAGAGSAIIAVVVGVLAAPGPLARGLGRLGAVRLDTLARSAQANVPTLRAALARSGRELRHPHPALLGSVAWWAFGAEPPETSGHSSLSA